MKCEQIKEAFMEAMEGKLPAEAAAHVETCAGCATAWAEHQKLMTLLDEWKAPEASPFFDTRLMARVRETKAEEAARPRVFAWLQRPLFGMPMWRPVAASALAVAMAVGIGVMNNDRETTTRGDQQAQVIIKGTAVSDLQTLDKHEAEISNLDLLDDLNAADSSQPEDQL
jgi:anti-sigma factor RsiW